MLVLSWLESYLMEYVHPEPCRVAGLRHSDGELWPNFLGQETHKQLPPSIQEYKRVPGH